MSYKKQFFTNKSQYKIIYTVQYSWYSDYSLDVSFVNTLSMSCKLTLFELLISYRIIILDF